MSTSFVSPLVASHQFRLPRAPTLSLKSRSSLLLNIERSWITRLVSLLATPIAPHGHHPLGSCRPQTPRQSARSRDTSSPGQIGLYCIRTLSTFRPVRFSLFLFLAHPSFRRILVLCIAPANKTPRVWPRGGQATVTHFPLRFVTFRVLVRQPWLLCTRSFRLCEPLLLFSLIARLCNASPSLVLAIVCSPTSFAPQLALAIAVAPSTRRTRRALSPIRERGLGSLISPLLVFPNSHVGFPPTLHLVSDECCGVGATSELQHAEIVVPATLTLSLLGYASLNAHPPVIFFWCFCLISAVIISMMFWASNSSIELEACYIMTHMSEAGSSICQKGAGESY